MSAVLDGYLEQERPVTAVPHELAQVVADGRMSLRSWGIQSVIWSQRSGQGFSVEALQRRYSISRRAWAEYLAEATALEWTRKRPRVDERGEFGGSVRWFAHPSKLAYGPEVHETCTSDGGARNGQELLPETCTSSFRVRPARRAAACAAKRRGAPGASPERIFEVEDGEAESKADGLASSPAPAVEAEPMPGEAEPSRVEAEPSPVEAEPLPVEAKPSPVEAEPAALDLGRWSRPKPTPAEKARVRELAAWALNAPPRVRAIARD